MSTVHDLRSIGDFPLRGSQLIEASAGTGKTWTIAMLYLRLVLGPHPGAAAIERALHPREILVVTFTDAATQELKNRIRQRLAEAATVFRDGQRDPDAWPEALQPIAALRALYPPTDWPALAQRLQYAADAMDEAAIATLHGWCQRVLREQAFASGTPFALTLVPDPADAIEEAAADLWRLQIQPLPQDLAQWVAQTWTSPQALAAEVRLLLPHADRWHATDPPLADTPVAEGLARALDARQAALVALKTPWVSHAQAALEALDAGILPKTLGRRSDVERWLNTLQRWAQDPDDDQPPKLGTGLGRLRRDWLQAQYPDGAIPPAVAALAIWDGIPALLEALPRLPSPLGWLWRHAAVWVQRRIAEQWAQRDQVDFDGLLRRLAQALDGPTGAALAARARARWPVALVDEFQDTDPTQLHILDRIYTLAQPAPHTALILIGDPKQAIYAFRQADIHSYLLARRACSGRLWRLDTNRRSSADMVAAVNHVFDHAQARRAEGAFLFRRGDDDPLPFVPVQAEGRAPPWTRGPGGPALPALILAHVRPGAEPWSKERLRDAVAGACANQVVQWLQEASEHRLGWATGEGWRPLRPGDIAILVNDRHEAQALQRALRQRGLASVYRSDRESVYASPEAEDLARWLHACAHPRDGDAIRAALATASLDLTTADIERLTSDDGAWEQTIERFERYHDLWQRHGVLPAVRALLHDFQVPQRLLARAGEHSGERTLTNLLHLAELLQRIAAPLAGAPHGMATVWQHLQRARQRALRGTAAAGDDSATAQLRLDSERERIPIVTVHKSKGLEYPVVCYPFAMHAKPIDGKVSGRGVRCLTWHDDEGRLQITLSDEGERWTHAVERADAERRAEDVRRLYVALTRARHATWAGLAATDTLPTSALGHVLGIDALPASNADDWLGACAQALAQGCAAIAVQTWSAEQAPLRWTPAADTPGANDAPTPVAARIAPPTPRPLWWIASYTALIAPTGEDAGDAAPSYPTAASDSARDEPFDEALGTLALPDALADPLDPVAAPATPPAAWHRWPRGPQAGTALHALLEQCARQGFAHIATQPAQLASMAQAVLERHGWPPTRLESDAADLAQWAGAMMATPLPLPGLADTAVALSQLRAVQPEWEFWLGAQRLEAATLDAWVRAHVPGLDPRPALRPTVLEGMLKGFIDLVFEHGGRYYVLDHKSNALGGDDSAYHPQAVQAAVAAHRYDLQAVLYLVALHRLLRQRLPSYSPAHHLGGALCVFWRGLATPGRGVYALPAPVALIERLDAALSGHTAAEAV
jgi:exodeoxyribonuclease V beta subunit